MRRELELLWMIVRGNFYRLIGKNGLLYWRRYSPSCKRCPFNSKNVKELTLLQRVWSWMSGEFCTECNCPLQAKLREPLSECPQLYWGQEVKTK